MIFKIVLINFYFIHNDESLYYRIFQSFAHDSIILFFIILFTYLSYFKSINNLISIFFRFLSLSIFIFYTIDTIILTKFATHLTINDIFKYVSYTPKYIKQLYTINFSTLLILIILLFILFFYIFKTFKLEKKSEHYTYLTILLILFSVTFFKSNGRYIHSWLFKNFVHYNYEILSQSKKYSHEFKNNINFVNDIKCTSNKKETPNIIILMVESLSSYQSKHFSGIKDWTPNLDKIAKENLSYKNFFANGFVTEDAEIAILTGELPIYAPTDYSNGGGVSFNGFYNIQDSLPYILRKDNYTSEFITSSDLEFSNTGKWARSIGFDYVEGSEHPYYKNKKRFHFNAPADEYLYDRVINRINKKTSNYFLFIKTVSSHAPFINPENSNYSESETIRYIDKEIGAFYNKLKELDFFKSGLLVIVGDHHPVVPLKNEELKEFGELKASSLVPLIIVTKNRSSLIEKQFQQTDIFNSLKNHVSDKQCNSSWKGDFLTTPINSPRFIAHRRGDERGMVSIFTPNNSFNLKLNGDDTKILKEEQNIEILNKINLTRIERSYKKYQLK